MVCYGGLIMIEQLQTYLIGLIPGLTLVIAAVPVIIKLFVKVKKVIKRDSDLAKEVKKLTDKLDLALEDNAKIRKENLLLRRQNIILFGKIDFLQY